VRPFFVPRAGTSRDLGPATVPFSMVISALQHGQIHESDQCLDLRNCPYVFYEQFAAALNRVRSWSPCARETVLDYVLKGEAMSARLGNVLFWLCIITAGAWLWFAHSIGADRDSPAMVYGGAGIALAVGWALRYFTRRRLG
jgi:hypothetical protein